MFIIEIMTESRLPDNPPSTLEEITEVLGSFVYESYGFPAFMLVKKIEGGAWMAFYRNAVKFSNPEINEKTPYLACTKLYRFLVETQKLDDGIREE